MCFVCPVLPACPLFADRLWPFGCLLFAVCCLLRPLVLHLRAAVPCACSVAFARKLGVKSTLSQLVAGLLSPFPVMPRQRTGRISLTLALSVVLHALDSAMAATIVSVSPTRGGLQGGTQVTISGSGFSRDGIQVRGVAVRLYHGHAVEYALVCRAQRLCTSATTFARQLSTSPTIRRLFACRRRTPSARACVSRKS